jgi:hypothetical protein
MEVENRDNGSGKGSERRDGNVVNFYRGAPINTYKIRIQVLEDPPGFIYNEVRSTGVESAKRDIKEDYSLDDPYQYGGEIYHLVGVDMEEITSEGKSVWKNVELEIEYSV